MPNDRTRKISEEHLLPRVEGGNNEVLVTEIYYADRRGYVLTIRPETHNADGTVSFFLTSGKSRLIQTAPRFNAKVLARIVPEQQLLDALRAEVMEQREQDNARRAGR